MNANIKVSLLIIPTMLIAGTAMTQSAFENSKKMIETCKSINTMRFTLKTEERNEGKMFSSKYNVKVQMKPLKIYQKQEDRKSVV